MDEEKKKLKILPKPEGTVLEMPSDPDEIPPRTFLEDLVKVADDLDYVLCFTVSKTGEVNVTQTRSTVYDMTYASKAIDVYVSSLVFSDMALEDDE